MTKKIECKNYPIFFDDWDALKEFLSKPYSSKVIIVDENTEKDCLPVFTDQIGEELPYIVIPEGERYKNLDTAKYIWQEMIARGVDRHSLCIDLGGGVIGDMGGWTASAFMRGMDFIQIPTTLLSMVDASVGGKLGIDFDNYKNLIGLIKDPNAVFIMPIFLQTLSDALIKSGFAEVLKHGLIADAGYWDDVKTYRSEEQADWITWIYQSVLIKKNITEEDPYEKGLRKILNFGHTLGHAIESLSFRHKKPLLHGEAIAIGMIMEAHLSYQKKYISDRELDDITTHLLSIYGKQNDYVPEYGALLPLLRKDKKNKGGKIMYSLLEDVGKGIYNQEASEEGVKKSIRYYLSL